MRSNHQSALPAALENLLPQGKLAPVGVALRQIMMLDRLNSIYEEILAVPDDRPFFDKLLSALNVHPQVAASDWEHIPKTGPVVVVANHPFGFIEGAILSSLLAKLRPDVKIMANSLLSLFPAINSNFIYVNPFGTDEAKRENLQGLRESIAHLRNGGMLVVFPAGEVAHVNLRERKITDPKWSETIARIIRMSKANVLPVYFSGANSPLFQVLGLLHARLRTAMLPHEFFNKQDRHIEIRIGSAIPYGKLETIGGDAEVIEHLRRRTYVLRHRRRPVRRLFRKPQIPARQEPVVAPVEPALMQAEVDRLPGERCLETMGENRVYYAISHEIPSVLREIGRLREVTFREAGEGTGKPIDIDAYDAYYLQLFIWNRETREIVGAYRLGATDVISSRFGSKGLYTNTLFAYRPEFLKKVGTAVELGRSFVRAEYQKSYTPLLLLWKGIGNFIARNPQYKTLFGPVSISNDYLPVSRQLMVTYFRQQEDASEWKPFLRARSPFRRSPLRDSEQPHGMREWDIEDLSAVVADIETDQKGIPILLRQYLKLGGRLLEFNVDKQFSDALDGLILVDLTKTDPKMLQRYLGKEGANRFLAHHGLEPLDKAQSAGA